MDKNKFLPFYMAYYGSSPGMGSREMKAAQEHTWEENPLEAELLRQQQEEALMQSYFSGEVREMQTLVEMVCDEEDYAGSRIYDEHPDREMVRQLSRRIEERAREELPDFFEEERNENDWREDRREDRREDWEEDRWEQRQSDWGRDRDIRMSMEKNMEQTQFPLADFHSGRPPHRRRQRRHHQNVIDLLLLQELRRRRCQNGRCR